MIILILKFVLQYLHFIPGSLFKLNDKKITKSIILFDTIQYKSSYKGDNLMFFLYSLVINIFQILNDIKKLFINKEIISIVSTVIFHEKDTKCEYIHSLHGSSKLYCLEELNNWPINILFNLIEKLELYNSFEKISLVIKVRVIEKF